MSQIVWDLRLRAVGINLIFLQCSMIPTCLRRTSHNYHTDGYGSVGRGIINFKVRGAFILALRTSGTSS